MRGCITACSNRNNTQPEGRPIGVRKRCHMSKRLAFIAVVSLSVSAACGLLAVLATAWVGDENRSWAATTRTCAAMLWTKKSGSPRSAGQDDGASASEPHTADLEWLGGRGGPHASQPGRS